MSSKEREYAMYITEHMKNVKSAFAKYGKMMCELLETDYYTVSDLINNHDSSKFSEEEFDLYRKYFFPNNYEEKISEFEFNVGWLHHIHSNPHHPEHWVYLIYETNKYTIFNMPDKYIIEMICDWIGMGIKFNDKAYCYYNAHKTKYPFTEITRNKVELLLKELENYDSKDL